jgi:SOS response regulatory protein OraA/RecX
MDKAIQETRRKLRREMYAAMHARDAAHDIFKHLEMSYKKAAESLLARSYAFDEARKALQEFKAEHEEEEEEGANT